MSAPGRVLLVGMMGAGKSTVGRLLAERLGWPYVDSDAEVEAANDERVADLFEHLGEGAFRRLESEALARMLGGQAPVVVSVAGGAVLDPANRALLRTAGTVVWLRARPETLTARVGDGAGRPLLAGDPAGAIERIDAARRELYAEVADHVVDVDGLTPESVVEQLVAVVAEP